jgi:hypothetical protein
VKEFPREEKGLGRTGYGRESSPRQLARAGFEKNAALDDFLSKVDFTTIRSIFEEQYIGSSGIGAKMNFIPPNRIYMATKASALATYHPQENIISINKKKGADARLFGDPVPFFENIAGTEFYAAPDIEDKIFLRIEAVFMLLHEEAHAVSSNSNEEMGNFLRSMFIRNERLKSGYRTGDKQENMFPPSTEIRLLGEIVNEGVTQLLALRVLSEYYRRKGSDDLGVSSIEVQKYISCFNNDLFRVGFSRKPEVEFVRIFVEYLAEVAEVPRDVIWKGVVRGYMHGGDLFDEHIAKAFEEKGMDDVFHALQYADTHLSNARFKGDDPANGKNVRADAIKSVNAQIYAALSDESKAYLADIFEDTRGIKVKKIGQKGWIPYAEALTQD